MSTITLYPKLAIETTIPALASFPPIRMPGHKFPYYIFTPGSARSPTEAEALGDHPPTTTIDSAHLDAFLALSDGDARKQGFLAAVQTSQLPGYTAPTTVRIYNSTQVPRTFPALGSYPAVTVPGNSSNVEVFSAHWTLIQASTDPTVIYLRSMVSAV